MRDLDTALLRTFVTLAETGSFSRTGALVGRSQSAVSGQIRRLEEAMGATLFHRDTRNVALTAEGEQMLAPARAMLAQAAAMLARFRDGRLAGTVRFGAPEDFASAYLPEVLGHFAAAHPAVTLHVTCMLTLPLVEALGRGEVDVIAVKQDPRRPFPAARPLFREALVWVSAPGAAPDPARPVPLVLSPAPCVYRATAASALEAAGLPWAEAFVSPSFAGCAAAVRAGLGLAVMPRGMVPAGLAEAAGWPALPDTEIALIRAPAAGPAAAALAEYVAVQVSRRG
jgi:DNA-binding transcriptional LysR family regulator